MPAQAGIQSSTLDLVSGTAAALYRSLLASSCAFSAASLANGEFGSATPRCSFGSTPLARLAAIAILEVAPAAFASRATILPIAIRPFAATALAWWRTPFALFWLVTTLAAIATPRVTRTIVPFRLRAVSGWRGRCLTCCGDWLCPVLRRGGCPWRRDLRARPAVGTWPPLAFAARRTRPALFGRTARAPDLDHLRLGRLLFRFCLGSRFGHRL